MKKENETELSIDLMLLELKALIRDTIKIESKLQEFKQELLKEKDILDYKINDLRSVLEKEYGFSESSIVELEHEVREDV